MAWSLNTINDSKVGKLALVLGGDGDQRGDGGATEPEGKKKKTLQFHKHTVLHESPPTPRQASHTHASDHYPAFFQEKILSGRGRSCDSF